MVPAMDKGTEEDEAGSREELGAEEDGDIGSMTSRRNTKQVIEGSPYRIGLAKKKVRRM
jgi:hypothetical protein